MRNALPASELRPIILGLNLVRLLVSNRIADFHIELETLTPEDQAHACIAFPKQLEQALMEGTYRQVLAAGNSAPSPHMTPLLAQLAATVRDELAGCASAVCPMTIRSSVQPKFMTVRHVFMVMFCYNVEMIVSCVCELNSAWVSGKDVQ